MIKNSPLLVNLSLLTVAQVVAQFLNLLVLVFLARYLEDYWLVDVYRKKAAAIVRKEYSDGRVLRAHYKGFTHNILLK